MRSRTIGALLFVTCLVSSPAQAQTRPDTLLAASRSAAFVPSSSQDSARVDWTMRIERARARQRTGKYLLYGGAAAAGIGVLLMSSGDDFTGGGRNKTKAGIWTLLGGGAVATLGVLRWRAASGDLEFLNREGRAKGYVAVLPGKDGVQVMATWSF